MTKTYGANIRCSVCGGEPWPDDPATRERFDLTRVGDAWFCEKDRPPWKRAPRAVAVTPDEALNEVARTFADRGRN